MAGESSPTLSTIHSPYLYYEGQAEYFVWWPLVFTANGANVGEPTVYWVCGLTQMLVASKNPGKRQKSQQKPTEPKAPTLPTITVKIYLQRPWNQKTNLNHQLNNSTNYTMMNGQMWEEPKAPTPPGSNSQQPPESQIKSGETVEKAGSEMSIRI